MPQKMQLEDLLLPKIVSLNPDLVTSAKPTGNGQSTGQKYWEPDPLGRQYSLVPKAKDLFALPTNLSTGLSGSPTHPWFDS